MSTKYATLALIAAISLASCGGGPVSSALSSNSGNVPLLETVAGSAALVDSATHRTLYYLDVDTSKGSACTGTCLSLWPFSAPDSGAQPQGNVSIITRSDGGGQQWSYQTHPLYFYSGDSGPNQNNGDGVLQDGGHWHVARPASSRSGGNSGGVGHQ